MDTVHAFKVYTAAEDLCSQQIDAGTMVSLMDMPFTNRCMPNVVATFTRPAILCFTALRDMVHPVTMISDEKCNRNCLRIETELVGSSR